MIERLRHSEAYRAAAAGVSVPQPTVTRRELFCIDRGPLSGPRTGCVGNDPHLCHRYETVVSHNGACQTCPGYEAEG